MIYPPFTSFPGIESSENDIVVVLELLPIDNETKEKAKWRTRSL